MYERFTDRARKVMQLANQEAMRFEQEYIGTEHILLGLIAEGSGVAANVLKNLDVDLLKIRSEVEKISPHRVAYPTDTPQRGRLPHTPRAKKMIEYAIEEARRLNHNYIGTEHILLGLLREQESNSAKVLMNFGLKLDDVRAEVMNLLGQTPITSRADVFHIAKSLTPEKAETYPVVEPTPPAAISNEQLQLVGERIEYLNTQKEEFVREQDFQGATRCRDEAEALKQLIAWYEWFNQQ